jgi:polar amino acid transport system substrate-binding protein
MINKKERVRKKIMKANNVKRVLTTILAATLAATSVTACGSGSSNISAEAAGNSNDNANAATENSGDVTVINAVTGGSPKPYISVEEDGSYSGYDIEVLQAVFDRLPQYSLNLQTAEFDAIFSGLTAGNYQIAVNNFSYNEKRAESYYYSFPYDEIKYVFVQRADDEPLTSLQDAADRGYKIEAGAGVNVTNAIEKWNEENPDSQIEIIYTEADLSVVFEHIQDGTSDFRVDDLPIYNSYIEEFGFDGLQKSELSAEETAKFSTALDAYFLFPLNDEGAALREDVNKVLKELQADGTLEELSQKYFGADQVPSADKFETPIN